MNKCIFNCRLTKDPSVKQTKNGDGLVARFTGAVEKRFKKEGGPEADFINFVAFGNPAKFVNDYAKQGNKFLIVGELNTGTYTDKDGIKRAYAEIVIQEIEFDETKAQREAKQNQASQAQTPQYNQPPQQMPQVPQQNYGQPTQGAPEFMNIPDGISEELPYL